MKYLIVTADDLGLTKSINEGIARACSDGIVTAVSIIPTGEVLEDAVRVAKDLPFKDIGAHIALSETKSILPAFRFYNNHNEFFFSMLFGKINFNDVYTELKAQLGILKKTGLKITHINSHEHIHIIPQVLDIFISLAREYDIPAIRFPQGDRPPNIMSVKEYYKSLVLNCFAGPVKKKLDNARLTRTDFFMGLLDAGRLDIGKIKMMLGSLKDGVTEIVTHPGFLGPEVLDRYPWHKGCEAELFALTDKQIKNFIKDNGIQLISYEDFLKLRK